MTLFEFIAGMISVILALTVGQLLTGVAALVQDRATVRASATHAVWATSLFMIAFLHWWSLWDFRNLQWNFLSFFFSLVGPTLLFFAVALINPRHVPRHEPTDLALHFRDVRSPLMWVLLAMLFFVTFDGPLLGTEPAFNRLRILQLIMAVSMGSTLASHSPRIHLAASWAVLLAVSLMMLVRFFPGMVV